MIAHKVAFHSNGQKLGQGMQPIMLPAGPGTASSNGEGSGNMMSTLLILGMAAIVTVFAVTVVMSDKRD
jgi:hypothetical protein